MIPARAASTRLPGKMLLCETGKSLIQHTYEAALQSELADKVIVGTDSEQILENVHGFGGEGCLTSSAHLSGTDRVAEVARQYPEFELIVNLQGDEPELPGRFIDQVIQMLKDNLNIQMGTLAVSLEDEDRIRSPDCVKVVVDAKGRALYFSRAAIPLARNDPSPLKKSGAFSYLQHIGLYVYRRELLENLVSLPPSPLELIESLEQLRVLQAGIDIYVAVIPDCDDCPKGIDTQADYAAFVSRQLSR